MNNNFAEPKNSIYTIRRKDKVTRNLMHTPMMRRASIHSKQPHVHNIFKDHANTVIERKESFDLSDSAVNRPLECEDE
jgi:hypothetical protein